MRFSRPVTRRLWALLALMLLPAVLLSSLAFAQRPPRRVETPRREQGPPRRFKNVQVLRGLSPEQLIATMRTYSASLGVRCDFCHVVGPDRTGFEKDTKPEKRTARRMILMVRDINQRERVLDRQATCYMCHHGHPQPETVVPSGEGPAGGPGRREGGERGERDRERGDRD